MELESLLQRAAAVPLGPLAVTYHASGPDAWTLTVTSGDASHDISAERDDATGGLILSCRVGTGASAALGGSWVSDSITDGAAGLTVGRVWLHGDGLSPALLFNALAALIHVAATVPDPPQEEIVAKPRIIISPPPPVVSQPVPIERPRPVGWNSFGRKTPEPEPEAGLASIAESPQSEDEIDKPPVAQPATEHPSGANGEIPAGTVAESLHSNPQADSEPDVPGVQSAPPTGAELAVDVPAPAGKAGNCRECGSLYLPDHAFCTNCGAKLN